MDLKDLCEHTSLADDYVNNLGARQISSYDDSILVSADAFLLGYSEDANSNNPGVSEGTDVIRRELYSLHQTSKSLQIIDLGNCRRGKTVSESYEILEKCMEILSLYGKPIIVFGGTQDVVCSLAKSSLQRVAYPSVCVIDSRIDWDDDADLSNANYYNKLISDNQGVRLIQVATQEYLSARDAFSWMSEHNFPVMRLGDCNANIELSEPLVRDAQLVSIDMNSVRYSDNPAGRNVNGLYSEFACQCAWNAGYSPRMRTFTLNEFNPQKDTDSISAQLCAQILWHVLDGISQRKKETCDFVDDNAYLKRYLKNSKLPQDICFFESQISQTMWVEIPVRNGGNKRVIPCSQQDYDQFKNGYIPDFWMMEFSRVNS